MLPFYVCIIALTCNINLFLFFSGCAGVIVGHPLDTVKVHLQTQDLKNPKYNGGYHCLKSLMVKDGIRGIFRGISSPLSGVAAINAIIFGVYGNIQRHQKDPTALTSCCIAGASAGLVQSFFTSPMELAKTRVQISGDKKSPLQVIKDIYRMEGVRGVFRGLNITMVREVPAFGSYFLSYEYMTRTSDGSPVSTATMLIAGGMAGVISWILCYPVDIIKSRIQVDGMNGSRMYKNSLDCLRKSISVEGYSFLMRGVTPAVIRAFPVNAVCFTVVTWTMRLLDVRVSPEVTNTSIWDALSYSMQFPESSALLL